MVMRLMVSGMVRLMVLVMVRLMVLVMVGGVNTSVQCVDLLLEVIPGPQWTTAFGSILIRTANLLWALSEVSRLKPRSSCRDTR